MIVRLISWAVFLSLIYGVWSYAHSWRSPLLPSANPVLSHLPPMTDDCLKAGCATGGTK